MYVYMWIHIFMCINAYIYTYVLGPVTEDDEEEEECCICVYIIHIYIGIL
jgi:hypothetical protein